VVTILKVYAPSVLLVRRRKAPVSIRLTRTQLGVRLNSHARHREPAGSEPCASLVAHAVCITYHRSINCLWSAPPVSLCHAYIRLFSPVIHVLGPLICVFFFRLWWSDGCTAMRQAPQAHEIRCESVWGTLESLRVLPWRVN